MAKHERLGMVNEYQARNARGELTHLFHTTNLACGTTPVTARFMAAGVMSFDPVPVTAVSTFYRLKVKVVQANFAFYRPGSAEFADLDDAQRHHVLNCGLLLAPIRLAVAKQAPHDTLGENFTYEEWVRFCEFTYGRTPPPWDEPEGDEKCKNPNAA